MIDDGKVRYRSKRAWKDGSTAVALDVATAPHAIDRAMAEHGLVPL